MATIFNYFCSIYGKALQLDISQSTIGNELIWHVSYFCGSCSAYATMDDDGVAPETKKLIKTT